MLKVFDYDTPTYAMTLSAIKGASSPLELTLLRQPFKMLLKDSFETSPAVTS